MCFSNLGRIFIHNRNEISFDSPIEMDQKQQRYILRPKVTTSDESLRRIKPKKLVEELRSLIMMAVNFDNFLFQT
jgi:epoxyqueuosine reductase QueG